MRVCLHVWLLLCALGLLCSCGSARVESAASLANASEIVDYLLVTELSENQHRAVASIGIAVNPALDYLSHGWMGTTDDIKATVPASAWKEDPVTAEKGVIYQAAKANAANDSWFSTVNTWTSMLYPVVAMLFGTSGLAIFKKIKNLKGALGDAIDYGNKALKVDPNNTEAITQLKEHAIARKKDAPHEKELNAALKRS